MPACLLVAWFEDPSQLSVANLFGLDTWRSGICLFGLSVMGEAMGPLGKNTTGTRVVVQCCKHILGGGVSQKIWQYMTSPNGMVVFGLHSIPDSQRLLKRSKEARTTSPTILEPSGTLPESCPKPPLSPIWAYRPHSLQLLREENPRIFFSHCSARQDEEKPAGGNR